MKFTLFIDGKATETTWGAYLAEGSLESLVTIPTVEYEPFNDWHERNGAEVPAKAPTTARDNTVTMSFIVERVGLSAFISYLKSTSTHTVKVPELSQTDEWTVSLKHSGAVDLDFDRVLRLDVLFTVLKDPAEGATSEDDETEFFKKIHELGFVELQGTRAEIWKGSEVKDHLNGQKKALTLEPYDITLPLFHNKGEAMKARNDLFRYLTQSGERTLTYDGRTLKAVYKSSDTEVLLHPDWWELSVTFTVTSF